jgi:hypothetical protein
MRSHPGAEQVYAIVAGQPGASGLTTRSKIFAAAALAWLFVGQALSAPQRIGGALVVARMLAAPQLSRAAAPWATPLEIAP